MPLPGPRLSRVLSGVLCHLLGGVSEDWATPALCLPGTHGLVGSHALPRINPFLLYVRICGKCWGQIHLARIAPPKTYSCLRDGAICSVLGSLSLAGDLGQVCELQRAVTPRGLDKLLLTLPDS